MDDVLADSIAPKVQIPQCYSRLALNQHGQRICMYFHTLDHAGIMYIALSCRLISSLIVPISILAAVVVDVLTQFQDARSSLQADLFSMKSGTHQPAFEVSKLWP